MHFNKTTESCAPLAKFGAETGDGVQRPAVHLMPAKNALPRPTPNAILKHMYTAHKIHVSTLSYQSPHVYSYIVVPLPTGD